MAIAAPEAVRAACLRPYIEARPAGADGVRPLPAARHLGTPPPRGLAALGRGAAGRWAGAPGPLGLDADLELAAVADPIRPGTAGAGAGRGGL